MRLCKQYCVLVYAICLCVITSAQNENEEYNFLCQKVKQLILLPDVVKKVDCAVPKPIVKQVADFLIENNKLAMKPMANKIYDWVTSNMNQFMGPIMKNPQLWGMGLAVLNGWSKTQRSCKSTTDGVKERYMQKLIKTLQPFYQGAKKKIVNWQKNSNDNSTLRAKGYKYCRSSLTKKLIKKGVKFCKPGACACEWNSMASILKKYGKVQEFDNPNIQMLDKPCW